MCLKLTDFPIYVDYIQDALKSKETLKSKYCKLFNTMNRVKQGNLSRQEVVNLYSQARKLILLIIF